MEISFSCYGDNMEIPFDNHLLYQFVAYIGFHPRAQVWQFLQLFMNFFI